MPKARTAMGNITVDEDELDELAAAITKKRENPDTEPTSQETQVTQFREETNVVKAEETKSEQQTEVKETETQSEQTTKQDAGEKVQLTVEERLAQMEEDFHGEMELRDIQIQKLQAQTDTWKSRYDRKAGELDFLRKNKDRQDDDADLSTDLLEFGEERESRETPRRDTHDSDTGSYLREHAVERAYLGFAADHGDVFETKEGTDTKELASAFIEKFTDLRKEYMEELTSGNPKTVEKAARRLLRDSRLAYLEEKKRAEIEEARQRRTVRTQENKKKTLANAATISTPDTSTNETLNLNDDAALENMPVEDLAKLLAKQPGRKRQLR